MQVAVDRSCIIQVKLNQALGKIAGIVNNAVLLLFFVALVLAGVMVTVGRTEFVKHASVGAALGGTAWLLVNARFEVSGNATDIQLSAWSTTIARNAQCRDPGYEKDVKNIRPDHIAEGEIRLSLEGGHHAHSELGRTGAKGDDVETHDERRNARGSGNARGSEPSWWWPFPFSLARVLARTDENLRWNGFGGRPASPEAARKLLKKPPGDRLTDNRTPRP